MTEALLVGLAAAIGQSDYIFGTAMLERPIVLGAIVGIFLGDIPTGVMVGFQLELAFMGVWQIGAAVPPNVIVGSVLGTAFAITTGAGPETALAIAMPTAVLAGMFDSFMYGVVTPPMAVWADNGAEKDNPRTISLAMWANGIFYIIALGLICGVAFFVGSDAVQALVDSIPAWLTTGLTIATGILPALGFAQLMSILAAKELKVFFFAGFLLSAYLGIPTIGVVCFSIVVIGVLNMAHIFMPVKSEAVLEDDDDNEF